MVQGSLSAQLVRPLRRYLLTDSIHWAFKLQVATRDNLCAFESQSKEFSFQIIRSFSLQVDPRIQLLGRLLPFLSFIYFAFAERMILANGIDSLQITFQVI